MQEIFRAIPGWDGLYQVSNQGRVRSLTRANGRKGKVLKRDVGRKSYCRVSLCKDGVITRLSVHRLVGEVFVANPEDKPQINHLDNNPENNVATNLEWSTQKENMLYSSRQGRQNSCRQLGCNAASEINQDKSELKYRRMLGSNFIKAFTKKVGNATRRIVTFNCPECANTYTERVDSVALRKRDGICSACNRKKI